MINHSNRFCRTFLSSFSLGTKLSLSKHTFPFAKSFIPAFSNKNSFAFSSAKDSASSDAEYVNLIFINKDKSEVPVKAKVGDNLLEIAHQNDIDLEGACDQSLACSTCHVILDSDIYDKLPIAKPEEEDMLDLAYGLTETSRLGCQVVVSKEFEGAKITLPRATRNMYVDGHKPKHH